MASGHVMKDLGNAANQVGLQSSRASAAQATGWDAGGPSVADRVADGPKGRVRTEKGLSLLVMVS